MIIGKCPSYFIFIFHLTLNCVHILIIGIEILAANQMDSVQSLSFDWMSKNLYWTDSTYKSVSVLRLADKSRRQIIQNLQKPRAIVVHPVAG